MTTTIVDHVVISDAKVVGKSEGPVFGEIIILVPFVKPGTNLAKIFAEVNQCKSFKMILIEEEAQ
jgi:rhamnose utilization protein RhaD (predicted bifunctional aldolase and dehydrogenase)